MSKRGDVVTLDNDLNISNELDPDDEEERFLRSFSYPRTKCTFLPNDVPAFGEILVLFLARGDVMRMRVFHLAREEGVIQVASVELNSNTVSYIRPKATSALKLCRLQQTSHVVNPGISVSYVRLSVSI